MADLEVSFPAPCGEPWDGMAPRGCNRHCATCDRIIHDLSALTIDQAEALLESGEEVCVRARVDKGGVVELADTARDRRRMIAAVGASLALASAACQTVQPPDRANRFAITGTLPFGAAWAKPVVSSSDGRTWPVSMGYRSRAFRAPDLYPGVYTITYHDACGGEERVIDNVTIRDQAVDLGQLVGDDDCLIIGVMVPANRPGRG